MRDGLDAAPGSDVRLNAGTRHGRGFSLVELMVAIALLALLTALVVPSLGTWLRNDQIRAVAGSLETGLRAARAEAIRRSRIVVFLMTADEPGLAARAAAGGTGWVVVTVPTASDAGPELIQASRLSDVASPVRIEASAPAVCFGSLGQPVAHVDTTRSVACSGTAPVTFDVRADDRTRPLRVVVNPSGQARWCDPTRSAAAGASDGC